MRSSAAVLLLALATTAAAALAAETAAAPPRLFPFHDKKNGGWGFINAKGKVVVKPTWEKAFAFGDGLARVKKDGYTGFADATGKQVIVPQYASAGDFHDGLAPVERLKDEFLGWIDAQNNVVITAAKLGIARGDEFHEGLAQALATNRTWGYVDTTGKWVIPAQFRATQPFSQGRAVVGTTDFVFGIIDTSGKWIVPAGLKNEPSAFGDGLAFVRQDDGKPTYVGLDGQVTFTVTVDESEVKAQFREFHEGLAAYSEKGLWGFLDATGKVAIPAKWAGVDGFSEGLAAVYDDKGHAGYVNAKGKVVVKLKYKSAERFIGGLARVEDEKKGWLYVNPKGKVLGQAE